MMSIDSVIVVICLVLVANIVSNYLKVVPIALIEIVLGFLTAYIFKVDIPLDSKFFMLLFVAPLLFNDATYFPKTDLWELRKPIFRSAVILVFLTSIVGGFGISLLIPYLSLPLAIALAAVLSPTDSLAVKGISERANLSDKFLSMINGESLFNDASGLIAFKYALAAFLTGYFSLYHATVNFLYVALVGALAGYVYMMLFYWFRHFLLRHGIEDIVLHTTLKLLSPFIIYLFSDGLLHASGIIAVVTAGLVSIYHPSVFNPDFSETRHTIHNMSNVLVTLLNGTVFIILGAELPLAMGDTLNRTNINNWMLFYYIFITWLIMLLIRTLWFYVLSIRLSVQKKDNSYKSTMVESVVYGLTGVRGAVTMATVMTLPMTLDNGKVFGERSFVIFLAGGVILMSIVMPAIFLPMLAKRLPKSFHNETGQEEETMRKIDSKEILSEVQARKQITESAIEQLKKEGPEYTPLAANKLISDFYSVLYNLAIRNSDAQMVKKYRLFDKETMRKSVEAEYNEICQQRKQDHFSKRSLRTAYRQVFLKKKSLNKGISCYFYRILFLIHQQGYNFYIKNIASKKHQESLAGSSSYLIALEKLSNQAAIQVLQEEVGQLKQKNEYSEYKNIIISRAIYQYAYRQEYLKDVHQEFATDDYKKLYLQVLDSERKDVQRLIDIGKIDFEAAQQIRTSINYSETSLL